jgi:hypothetical protein
MFLPVFMLRKLNKYKYNINIMQKTCHQLSKHLLNLWTTDFFQPCWLSPRCVIKRISSVVSTQLFGYIGKNCVKN